jgi:hypothetical protein
MSDAVSLESPIELLMALLQSLSPNAMQHSPHCEQYAQLVKRLPHFKEPRSSHPVTDP